MGSEGQVRTWETIYQEYQQAISWLNSHEMIAWLGDEKPATPSEIRTAQEQRFARIQTFIDYIGNPQHSFHSIHITGTGGKGSTATMVEALLRHAGETTGLHTSPYVQIPNEKLILDGRMISPSLLTRELNILRTSRENFMRQYPDLFPVYSDVWMGLTFRCFQHHNVTWAAIEAGMGGRFDATNVLQSDIAVITNVALDHVVELGGTLEQIAWHKAGIIKPGRPVVVGQIVPEALPVILQEAHAKQAPVFIYGKDFYVDNINFIKNGMQADIHTPFGTFDNIYINLLGQYQAINAATAVMAVALAVQNHGVSLNKTVVEEALANITFCGRMEQMQDEPLVIIDGAHNPQKMTAAARALATLYPHRKKTVVIGMVASKDAIGTLEPILKIADNVIATSPNLHWKPCFSAQEMYEIVKRLRADIDVVACDDIKLAVREAIERAREDTLIFVTGSIYMLEHVREIWYPTETLLQTLEP